MNKRRENSEKCKGAKQKTILIETVGGGDNREKRKTEEIL